LPIRQALDAATKDSVLTDRAEARLVLIVDQLEELFTIDGLTLDQRRIFVATLDALAIPDGFGLSPRCEVIFVNGWISCLIYLIGGFRSTLPFNLSE